MLDNSPFYFHTFRNLIVGFGDLFNNVQTVKLNSDGVVEKQIIVPIAFARRQKYLSRLREDLTKTADPASPATEITLPRMSYDVTSWSPDPSRKLSPLTKQVRSVTTANVERHLSQLSPNPYNMGLDLTIYTYSLDEMLQIVEQILPFFTPDFNLTIIDIPELGISKDVPIVLSGVEPTDSYEGAMTDDYRIIEWTLTFDAAIEFYPPVKEGVIIRTAITNIQEDTTPPIEQKTTQDLNPLDAKSTDDYSIDKVIEESST